MSTTSQISIDTYLTTPYQPDVDYVDGVLQDRNVGEYDHNVVQQAIQIWFYAHGKDWRIRVNQGQRTRVGATRVRIPDVCVFSRDLPIQQVFTKPQMIAIEILSPEDRHSRIEARMNDFRELGVPNLWVVDPQTRSGWDLSDGNWVSKERFEVADSPIYLSLPELFAKIDEDNAD